MMQRDLWAPWRMAYLRELEASEAAARANGETTAQRASTNFLLAAWRATAPDATAREEALHQHHVVIRDSHGIVILNRYPYANGHVLIALGEPSPALGDYSSAQRAHFWRLVDEAAAAVQRAFSPQGINIGVNEGRAAGAGLPEHVHAHVVPRWGGDTNFMATIGDVRVIPDSLDASWRLLRAAASGVTAS